MDKIKSFQIRLPHEIWVFLKKQSVSQEKSMNLIIGGCLEKYKNRLEKRLTNDDSVIS